MGYLRRNLYNQNLIEIPNFLGSYYGKITKEEKEFMNYCHDKIGCFFDLTILSDEEVELMKSLSRFCPQNPSKSCSIKELERIFIESIYDGNKELGMQVYFKLKEYYNSKELKYNDLLSWNETVATNELVRYIVSNKLDFKKYVQSDFKQVVYRDGERSLERTVTNKVDPIDFYLDGMFVDREGITKLREKKLEYKKVDDRK